MGASPSRLEQIQEWLGAPLPIYSLAVFRIWFAALAAYECLLLMSTGALTSMFVTPETFFPYYGLGWIRPLPGSGIYLHFFVTFLAAVGMTVGLFYRTSTAIFCIGWTWFWLIDQSYFQNHAYLISLVSAWLVFMPAQGVWSVDNLLAKQTRRTTAPAWTVYLLRTQMGIVYLYAAFAKTSADWLAGEPMRGLVQNYVEGFSALNNPAFVETGAYTLSYGGLLFDLVVVPALLWRKTRPFAFIAALGFHLTNSQLFNIDIFPWLAIGATTIFFEPDWPVRLAKWLKLPLKFREERMPPANRIGRVLLAILTIYLVLQATFPFRHVLHPGQHNWTEAGQRFSWFLMARSKAGGSLFLAKDPASGNTFKIDPNNYLNPRQARRMAVHPDMIWLFSQFVVDHMARQGYPNVEVRALTQCRLNSREPASLVDPDRNLAAEPRRLFTHYDWIAPFPGPLTGHEDHDHKEVLD